MEALSTVAAAEPLEQGDKPSDAASVVTAVKVTKTKKNNTNKYKKDFLDGGGVFKFQLREEHRINKTFDNIEDFLHHWLTENGCKDGKLKQLFHYKRPHKKTRASKGLENFRKEASERYGRLTLAQKALYRAVGKEYFIKNRHG